MLDSEDRIALAKAIIGVTGHELVHQWFGNLVTMDWWSHIWLNEGITSYFEDFASDAFDAQGILYVVKNRALIHCMLVIFSVP